MPLIVWRKEFETGIADVDHEHQELVELLNQLHKEIGAANEPEKINDFLGEVFARISSHFALEESIMRKYDYDQYEDHKGDHEKLLDEIRDIMDDFEAGDYDINDGRLSQVVHDWFVDHFKTRDARLHAKLGV